MRGVKVFCVGVLPTGERSGVLYSARTGQDPVSRGGYSGPQAGRVRQVISRPDQQSRAVVVGGSYCCTAQSFRKGERVQGYTRKAPSDARRYNTYRAVLGGGQDACAV